MFPQIVLQAHTGSEKVDMRAMLRCRNSQTNTNMVPTYNEHAQSTEVDQFAVFIGSHCEVVEQGCFCSYDVASLALRLHLAMR